jgi:hypothetical protein
VYLEDETKHPTRTTKDRNGVGVLSYFREIGLWEFVSSSTGNSSTSFALGAGAHLEFTIHLYCGEAFLYAMNWPDYPNVKLYVLEGATFVEAFDFSRAAGPAAGRIMGRSFFNPARAIMRGDPTHVYPYMRALVKESGGTFESASEQQILDAQRLIPETEGIPACPASACTLAGLRKLMAQGTVSTEETVMLNITGADREFTHPKHYTILERTDSGWVESQSV